MRDSSNWTESYDSPESSVRRQDCADGLLTGKMCIDSEVIGNYKFLPSIGKDKNDLCLGCITEKYPLPIEGERQRGQATLEEFEI